jgi:hypothetical protein
VLEQEGWAERKQGSGVYVRQRAQQRSTPEQILDGHIAGFFRAVRELHLPEETVRARVAQWLEAPRPDHFLVIDPDPMVRQILLTEIGDASQFPAKGCTIEECRSHLKGAVPLCRPSQAAKVRAALPMGVELITLEITSANVWLKPWVPVTENALIAVVSHWPDFLEIARTMLIAAGIGAEALVVRDAREAGWRQGLEQAARMLCDAHTAKLPRLKREPERIVFPLISEEMRAELGRWPRVGLG